MNKYLQNLATQVLFADKNKGISKVRFAKTIYFVFKALVKDKLAQSTSLEFKRLPLGPVPVGFENLTGKQIKVTKQSTGLSFDAEIYHLVNNIAVDEKIEGVINDVVSRARQLPTSKLVELSHKDTSWKNHKNGETYFITDKDIKNKLPRKGQKTDISLDKQHLKASLISGMIDEIVDESTKLEYPKE